MLKCKPRVTQQEEDKHSSFHLTQLCLHSRWTFLFRRINHGVYQSCFLLTTLLIAYGFFFILLKVNSRVSQGKKHIKSLHTCK